MALATRKPSGRRSRAPSRPRRPKDPSLAACCKRFTAFMFSHIGLCALVVAYAIFGAFVFRHLEAHHEDQKAQEVQFLRDSTIDHLWTITMELNVLFKDNWTVAVNQVMRNFSAELVRHVKEGYDGKEAGKEGTQWSLGSAFLYSLTVITTIGYGNISPKTAEGRVATIVYALVGIPLMLLYLTNIGDLLAKAFKYSYVRLCVCRGPKRGEPKGLRASRGHFNSFPPANLPLGHTAPNPMLKPPSLKLDLHDLSLPSAYNYPVAASAGYPQHHSNSNDYYRSMDRVSVPISLCMAIITLYICAGAFLFSFWEKEWDYLEGSYFCFVTLSTIGFGDLVPGQNIEGSEQKLAICSIYLLAGLALIAMCFNLVQEQVVYKLRKMGKHLGVISDSELDSSDPE